MDKSGCFRAKVVVFGEKWLYAGKVVVFRQNGCFGAKVVVFGQKLLYLGKVVVFDKKGIVFEQT